MAHTKGPWNTDPDRKLSKAGVYAGDGDETIICDVTDEDIGSRVERDANARLIAAAPQMLAALLMLRDDPGLTESTNDVIKCAIRDATGKS